MVTSVEELKKVKSSLEVSLPPFADGTMITVKVRRVHFLDLIADGKIPNPLLRTVSEMIGGKKTETSDNSEGSIVKNVQLMRVVAQSALETPTYSEIKEFAGGLSDAQLSEIYDIAMGDPKKWQKFC